MGSEITSNDAESVFSAETTDSSDNTAKEQRGRPFKEGQSGNPSGRPKGSRNKATLAVQALLEGEAEAITRKAIESAKSGDMQAIKLVLERLLPPRKDSPIEVELPELQQTSDVPHIMATILGAVSSGQITPSEGQALSAMVEHCRKSIELHELEQRIEALEGIQNDQ